MYSHTKSTTPAMMLMLMMTATATAAAVATEGKKWYYTLVWRRKHLAIESNDQIILYSQYMYS